MKILRKFKKNLFDRESKSKIKSKENHFCDKCEKNFTSFTSLYYHKIRVPCPKEVRTIFLSSILKKKVVNIHV